ncbi:Bcr/CflA family efflux MFS transporter [Pseudomonas sp. RIT-PI-S]|uniref:Bcr/CflA family efflux MFS transporter n=1 Tax=Pseudomonas sp. RIT-PI-S TaxID=3035295 RepID=UPI0021D95AF3|nr:Bcr/CflA family efflux MFS transporter [Pseudomonas sp. RIT-PI-S]
MPRPPSTLRHWALLLVGLVCLPRVALDLYLPAWPAMAAQLQVPAGAVQASLTLYMAGYAVSMLVTGTLCDRFGRRPTMLAGLGLYLLATLGCALAPNLWSLCAARFFQALGGCCGPLVARVVVRDRFAPYEQVRLLSALSSAMAIAPIVAPLLGSLLLPSLGWRGLFLGLLLLGALTLWQVRQRLPETRLDHGPAISGRQAWRQMLGSRAFWRYSLVIGFAYCSYFPFISESSVLLQRGLGLTPRGYALVLGLTVLGYVAGSRTFAKLSSGRSIERLLGLACVLNLAGSSALLCLQAQGAGLWLLLVALAPVMFSVGLIIPACQWAVLQPFPAIAGTVSGGFFFVQMLLTCLSSAITGAWSDGSAWPMVGMTFAASVGLVAVERARR